jgi:hypothetical protein
MATPSNGPSSHRNSDASVDAGVGKSATSLLRGDPAEADVQFLAALGGAVELTTLACTTVNRPGECCNTRTCVSRVCGGVTVVRTRPELTRA